MGAKRSVPRKLTVRISLLIAVVVTLSVVVYAHNNSQVLAENRETEVLNEARTLSLQMQATWDYIDQAQDAINYNSDGRFDFKGIYCSIAGKSIAQNFTRSSEGYMIRYARTDPRSSTDVPDAFETAALEAFAAGDVTEYYEMAECDGKPVFRYASALEVKRNCLACHGTPEGEYDIVGFRKEGMVLGDLAGAVSIAIPLDTYLANSQSRNISDTLFYVWLVAAVAICIYLALRLWVAKPLTKMNEELVKANEASSTFLMTMSHEMRTPISAIMAYTDLIEDGEATASKGEPAAHDARKSAPSCASPGSGVQSGDVNARNAEYLHEIRENSRQLLSMVNNVIDAARIEANAFTITSDEVDVSDLVQSVVSMVEPLAVQRGVAIKRRVGRVPVLWSDWDALFKILNNLVGNAVKFSDGGAVVTVSVSYDETARLLSLRVADTGRGIPQDRLEEVFCKFAQVSEAAEQGQVGSGLGLYLVKALSEAMGGSVSVQSKQGKGSTFTVTVPARPARCLGE